MWKKCLHPIHQMELKRPVAVGPATAVGRLEQVHQRVGAAAVRAGVGYRLTERAAAPLAEKELR